MIHTGYEGLSNLTLKLILNTHTGGMSTDQSITIAAGSLASTRHKNIYLNLKAFKPELDFALICHTTFLSLVVSTLPDSVYRNCNVSGTVITGCWSVQNK